MEIRKIKKEERLACKKIMAVAFQYSYDCKIDENEVFPDIYADQYGAFDEDGTLMAHAVNKHHRLYFDGHIVESAGIGGVATLPQYRHKRAVRRILELIFEDMRKNKQIISQLHPFSFAYYNKFGYETVYEKINIKFPFSLLDEDNKIERNNRCRLIDNNKDPDLRRVYEKYASVHNGAYNRNDIQWDNKVSKNIYEKTQYPYVYYNENNEPAGYFLFTGDNGFKILELCYESPEDIRGILGFIKNFSSNYESIYIDGIPADEDFSLMFINQYKVERSLCFYGMTCIADVKKILELMRYPDGNGNFSIAVEDKFQAFNTGIYQISYKDGNIEDISQKPIGSTNADICVSHPALAKLIFGTDNLCADRYRFMDSIQINGNIETLKKVFCKKKIYLGDFF